MDIMIYELSRKRLRKTNQFKQITAYLCIMKNANRSDQPASLSEKNWDGGPVAG